MATYNGWKNRATWNVALYIQNDESIYFAARSFMAGRISTFEPYKVFIHFMGMEDDQTPDGFKYLGSKLSYKELNEMMREIGGK